MVITIDDKYREWLNAVNTRDWESARNLLAANIVLNGHEYSSAKYIEEIKGRLQALPDEALYIDMLVVDHHQLAARIIHTATLKKPYEDASLSGQKVGWSEHVFCWFDDSGEISGITKLEDMDGQRRNETSVARTPNPERRAPQTPIELAEMYRQYIEAINNQTMKERFPQYCQDRIIHNTRQLSIDEYRLFIESSFDEIQGLVFTIKHLVVDYESQQIGARLEFTGRAVKEFMGIEPTGKEVKFCEHVLYALDQGKIVWVWSILDLDSYRRCL